MAANPTPPKKEKPASPPPSADDRFRYIGFGVYPKKAPKFWRTDAEEKSFLDRVRDKVGRGLAEREFSTLHEEVITLTDRVVLTIAALVMVGSTLIPWVQFRTNLGTDFSLSWGAALGTLLGGFGTAFAGGIAVGISAICALVLLFGGPILGLWILAVLWMKAKTPEAYQVRLRRPLKLGYLFLYSALALAILSFIGGHIPGFASWGMIDPGEKYGFGTLLTLMSYGPFVLVAMGMVTGVKSGEL
jgi:hypothetical protein